MVQCAHASEQTKYGQSGKETEAGKEEYRTKARMSSALFTGRRTSEKC